MCVYMQACLWQNDSINLKFIERLAKEIYLNKFNWYLFDIDVKGNKWDETDENIIKSQLREKVLNYFDYDNKILEIHAIFETKNWFHLLHFFDKPIINRKKPLSLKSIFSFALLLEIWSVISLNLIIGPAISWGKNKMYSE